MKVYLDDIRKAPDDSWVVVKSAIECIEKLQSGKVRELSLDHDLGKNVLTGYDVCKWIEREVVLHKFRAPKIKIHSANPVGRKNMEAAISSIKRFV